MRLGILGKKIGMTQLFDEKGNLLPVTVVDTSGCIVSQVKSPQTDGYSALQLSIGERKVQNLTKAVSGHLKKPGIPAKARLKELRLPADADLTQVKAGQALSASMFQKGDKVDIVGTSKGKGFTGVMKRFGFSGKDATHGTSKYFRHGGSNGSNTFPGRVLKNKGMPGQTGNARATAQNLEVFDVRPSENLILILGPIPGHRNSIVEVLLAKKKMPKEKRSLAFAS